MLTYSTIWLQYLAMFKLTQIDMTGQQDTNGNSSTHISQSTTIAYSRSNSSAYGDLETP